MTLLDDLMAWWDCEEDGYYGHTLMDKSGRCNHLLTTGTYKDVTNNTFWGERSALRVDGKVGYAVAPGFIHTPHTPDLDLENEVDPGWTFCAWVRIPAANMVAGMPDLQICRKGKPAADREYEIYYSPTAHNLYATVNDGGFLLDLEYCGGHDWIPNVWYFIAIWRNLFPTTINNGQVGPYELGGSVNANHLPGCKQTANNIYIGTKNPFCLGNSVPNYASLHLDSVGVWKRVLTFDEIFWLYNDGDGRGFADIYTSEIPPIANSITCNCDDLE